MPYAAVSDMIARFGESELIEISTPPGQDMDTIHVDAVNTALADASDEIDGYLRRRYVTPVLPVPAAIVRACCAIARYHLCTGGRVTPSEKVTLGRQQAQAWLGKVQEGRVTLDGEALSNDGGDWSRFQGRPAGLSGRIY